MIHLKKTGEKSHFKDRAEYRSDVFSLFCRKAPILRF